jgi:hypothetical protein
VQPFHTDRPPHKMLSRGGSLGESTADPDRLLAWVARNLERLIEELEWHAVKAGRLHVWLGYANGGSAEANAPLLAPTDRFGLRRQEANAAKRLCPKQFVRGSGVELCEKGYALDVLHAARLDLYGTVPLPVEGRFVNANVGLALVPYRRAESVTLA